MDTAYGPEPVYELARQKNTDAAIYNADSWTMTALAIFAQMEFNLSSPPIPLKYHPGSNSSLLPPSTSCMSTLAGSPLAGCQRANGHI
ncbi:hypothetical protein V8E54_003846 [Elaphomyces granulatus]